MEICQFYRDKRHDLASLVVPRERKFPDIWTILARYVVQQSLKRTSEFQPPSFLTAWDTGGQIWTLGVSAPTAGVIIMKKEIFPKTFFFECTIENSRFWGHPKFWG